MDREEETMNLIEWEVKKLKEYGMEEELAAIDRGLGRKLSYRQQNWTKYPKLPAPSLEEPIRIMLLGEGGSGKSALGNVILGEQRFKTGESAVSQTQECQVEKGKYGDQDIIVIDTPSFSFKGQTGYGTIGTKENDPLKEIIDCMKSKVHVFIFVINNSYRRSRDIGVNDLKAKKILNPKSSKHFMMVATHSLAHYSGQGTKKFLDDLQDDPDVKTFLKGIDERVVMVELGQGPATQDAAQSGTAVYEKERKQACDMVMSMVGKVVDDTRKSGLYYVPPDPNPWPIIAGVVGVIVVIGIILGIYFGVKQKK